MKLHRSTHPSDNLDPFWVGDHRGPQILLMRSECEEKPGEAATSCCTHFITSFNNVIVTL